MKLTDFLRTLDYTVTTSGASFDDECEGYYIDVYLDPHNSSNNKVEVSTDMDKIKLSEAEEIELYDFLYSLWQEEVEAWNDARELKQEQLDNISRYGNEVL